MKKFILDGKKMTSQHKAHEYIKNTMNFPEYYGYNLDALYDMLSTYCEQSYINLINDEIFKENLGNYADSLIEVFYDAASENSKIHFHINNKEKK